jgi:antitoxin component HigA of HigAB toxin-antitoxin module
MTDQEKELMKQAEKDKRSFERMNNFESRKHLQKVVTPAAWVDPNAGKQPKQRKEPPPIMWEVIFLHLNGKTRDDIADELGIKPMAVTRLLNDERAVRILNEHYQQLDAEMKAQYSKVVKAVGGALDFPDPRVQLSASQLWMKVHGKFEETLNVNLSAEDLVRQIMDRKRE